MRKEFVWELRELAEKRWAILIPLCLYLVLAGGRVATNEPWCDEGWFASSSVNLVTRGFMGNTIFVPERGSYPNLDRYTYWLPPAYFLLQAMVYRVAGLGLVQTRLIALLFGVAGLWAIHRISLRVFKGNRLWALVATTFVCTSFFYVKAGSDGRMDMMAASLSLLGWALFLELREVDLSRAMFFSNALICLSGLTHPNGLLGLIGLGLLVVYLDRDRITPRMLLTGAVPYMVGGALWGAYIMQDYDSFHGQFFHNTLGREESERFAPGLKPRSAYYEIVTRYLKCYGVVEHGGSLIRRSPAPVLLLYLMSFAAFPFLGRGLCRLPWIMLLLLFLSMMFLVGSKTCTYLVWISPLFMLNALYLYSGIGKSRVARGVLGLLLLYALVFNLASTSHVILRDDYGSEYLHDLEEFNSTHYAGGLIHGSGELAFFFGFDEAIIQDDNRLGFESGVSPSYIVVSPKYENNFERDGSKDPQLRAFLERRLSEEYALIYPGRRYGFYEWTGAKID